MKVEENLMDKRLMLTGDREQQLQQQQQQTSMVEECCFVCFSFYFMLNKQCKTHTHTHT